MLGASRQCWVRREVRLLVGDHLRLHGVDKASHETQQATGFTPSTFGRAVRITLKCDPVLSEILRDQFAAITPGYHTDKRHWITIHQDDNLPDEEIARLIDHSYEQVRNKLSRKLRATLP